jgi:phosphoribosylanthranilate isomerase
MLKYTMTRVKICGITGIKDASAAVKAGADALGFVFFSKSPRSVSPDRAKEIIASLPPFTTSVGVFVNEDKSMVKEIVSYAGLDIIQLHGNESPEYCSFEEKIIKAIRVKELSDLEPLKKFNTVSAFLLDTYSPDKLGGTGQAFNWEIAVEAKKFGRIILAGGLTPENVEEAISFVQPYGVDVSSGVEGPVKGQKDQDKLKSFIKRARSASMKYA